MSEDTQPAPPHARVAHATRGRLRVKIEASPGRGEIHQLASELREMPDTLAVRANHRARSVTVTYDPNRVTAPVLLERLCRLGLVALDLTDPGDWAEMLAEQVVPRAEDPQTLPGRLNLELLLASRGTVDMFRLTVALLLVTAGIQVRRALLRGDAIPWMRVLAYMLAAASLWTSRRRSGESGPVLRP
jgi:hypothetical protein